MKIKKEIRSKSGNDFVKDSAWMCRVAIETEKGDFFHPKPIKKVKIYTDGYSYDFIYDGYPDGYNFTKYKAQLFENFEKKFPKLNLEYDGGGVLSVVIW